MMQPHKSNANPTKPFRRAATVVIRWSLFLLVLWFVYRRGSDLWRQGNVGSLRVRPGWLLLAGCSYLVGWIPSILLWQRLIAVRGNSVRFPEVARAYFGGHVAKYVPGKALVLIVRAGLIHRVGVPTSAAALTAAYETLTTMWAGALVALALAPNVFPNVFSSHRLAGMRWMWGSPVLFGLAVAAVGMAMLPVMSRILARLSMKMAPSGKRSPTQRPRIQGRKLVLAALWICVGWSFHGLSLGLTIRAISERPFRLDDWPMWTMVISLATVAGFAVLIAPGGLGVREGLMMELLSAQPLVGRQTAVVASVLLRGVWLAAELLAACILYWAVRSKPASGEPA